MILELYCRNKEGKKILMKVIGGEFTFHFFAPLNNLYVRTNSGVEEYFCEELEYSVNGNFVYASIDSEKMFNDNNSAKDCKHDEKNPRQ